MTSLLRVTALTLLGAAPLVAAAQAQPDATVTVYGVADMCATRIDLGATARNQTSSGCHMGSRFGFRGTETLGGGNKAWFTLEGGVNMNDGSLGQGGRMFGRRALVGVGGGSWGSLEGGRDNAPNFYLVVPIDPTAMGFGTIGNTLWTGSSAAAVGRTNNALNYLSPNLGAVSARLQYGFSDTATGSTQTSGGQTMGANVVYKDGDTMAGVAWAGLRNATRTGTDRAVTAVVKHTLGAFSVSAVVQVGSFEGSRTAAAPASATAIFSRDYRSYLIGGTWQATPQGRVIVSLKWYDDRTASNFDATQTTVSYIHALSKRTDVYVGASVLKNKRNSSYSIQDAGNAYGGVTAGATTTQYAVGIKHSF